MPLDDERDSWRSKQARHSFQHLELATLHVDLHDVGGTVDEVVQPHDRHT